MSDEDFTSLERVRAMCLALCVAVGISMDGDETLNLANTQEMLRNGNRRLQDVINNYGGYDRVMKLRGQGKIDDAM
jgi:hypothetical protein